MSFSHESIINLSAVLVEGNSKQRIFIKFLKEHGISGQSVNFLIACYQLREHVGYIHFEDLYRVLSWYNKDAFVLRLRAIKKTGWLSEGVGNTLILEKPGEDVIFLFCSFFAKEMGNRLQRVSALARSPRRAGRVSSLLSSLPTNSKGPID